MASLTHRDSIIINAEPAAVYEVISDVTRTGEWSKSCTRCVWDDGDGPRVGAWFTGFNRNAERTWESRSQVTAADGVNFAWSVGEGNVLWGYQLAPGAEAGSTELTHWWEFTDAGQAAFVERWGERAAEQVMDRQASAQRGIAEGLATIKRIVEAA